MRQMYGVKVSVLTWGGPVRGGESAEVIVSAKKCGGEGLNDKRFPKFEGHEEIWREQTTSKEGMKATCRR